MKKFITIASIGIDDKQYNNVTSWNVEVTDWINSVLADHGRDRGMMIKMRTIEVEYDMLEDVCRAADAIAKDKAFDELEEAVLKNAMCVGGNCEA